MAGLQQQEIARTPGTDPRGDVLLAARRVEGDDAAVKLQGVEQLENSADLVRLALGLALTGHQALITCPSARGRSDGGAAGADGAAGALSRGSGP